jgi:hypothetical protein
MNRKRRLTTAAVVLVAAATAGGVAYATIPDASNVYSACMLKGIGTIRLIDKSLPSTNLMSHCTDKETEITWNQAGQPGPAGPQGAKGEAGAPGANGANGTNGADGKDGVSVTTASERAGANCGGGGGIQLTAANGVSYVCNGKAGADGKDGANGANGTDGKDGVSVTSAVEPAGTNCANGGSKFTAANGVTYACNGANGAGAGIAGYEIVSGSFDVPPGTGREAVASCPAGKVVIGGGYEDPTGFLSGNVYLSAPGTTSDNTGYGAYIRGTQGWVVALSNNHSSIHIVKSQDVV